MKIALATAAHSRSAWAVARTAAIVETDVAQRSFNSLVTAWTHSVALVCCRGRVGPHYVVGGADC